MKINRISAAAGVASTTLLAGCYKKENKMGLPFLNRNILCEALVQEEDKKRLHSINTNTYVWGEGFQVDPT